VREEGVEIEREERVWVGVGGSREGAGAEKERVQKGIAGRGSRREEVREVREEKRAAPGGEQHDLGAGSIARAAC
jgi:hypothetical protein